MNNKNNYGLADLVNDIGKIFEQPLNLDETFYTYNWTGLENTADYKYVEENGVVKIEMVVAGHNPENIKVKWNEEVKILKIVDEIGGFDASKPTPWYFKEINSIFTLPSTTDKETFSKTIKNGVLTVTVSYAEPKAEKKVEEIEI